VTGTTASGGLTVAAFGVEGVESSPVTWAGATTAGSTMEASATGSGNSVSISAASVSAPGSASVTAEGNGANTGFTNNALIMLAFPPTGVTSSALASIAIPRKMFLKPKSKFYLR